MTQNITDTTAVERSSIAKHSFKYMLGKMGGGGEETNTP